jgi:uncharacterized protein YcbK (DUF882 family)
VTDLASLVVKIDSSSAKDAALDLDKLLASGAKAEKGFIQVNAAAVKAAGGFHAFEAEVLKAAAAQETNAQATGRMGAQTRALSGQLMRLSTGLSSGQSPFTVLAGQGALAARSFAETSSSGHALVRFLTGPWGWAMVGATAAFSALIAQTRKASESVDDLVKKMKEQASQAHLNAQANAVWERSLDGLIEKTRKLHDESERALQTERQLTQSRLDGGRAHLAQMIGTRDRIGRELEAARRELANAQAALAGAGNFGDPNDPGAAAAAAAAQQRAARAQSRVTALVTDLQNATAAAMLATTTVENLGVSVARVQAAAMADPIKARFQSLREEAERTIRDVDKLTQRLAQLDKQEKAALEAARPARTGRTKQQAYQDFVGALGAQGVPITSGYRTQAQQDALRRRLGSDAAQNSLHTAHRAVDVAITVSDERILAAAGQAGLKGVRIQAKPNARGGAHKHVSWSGAGDPGDDSSVESIRQRMAREAAREADQALRRSQAFEAELDKIESEILRAKGQALHGIDAQADFALDMLEADQRNYEATLDRAVAADRLNAIDAEALKLKHANLTYLRASAVEDDRQLKTMEQQSEIAQRLLQDEIDALRFTGEMVTTSAEQRRAQLDIVDALYAQRLHALEAAKQQALLVGNMKDANDIQEQINRLAVNRSRDKARVIQGTRGPWEQLEQGFKPEQMIEDLERIKVRGFDSLTSAIHDVVMGTKSLEDAFRDMSKAIISDIIQMTIRMLIFQAISGMMGGPSAGGGAIRRFFGGPPSFNGNVFSHGNIVPFRKGGVVDQLSFFPMGGGKMGSMAEDGPEAIMPLARDSSGRLGVRTDGGSAPIEVHVTVEASEDLMVKAAVVADSRIQAAEPRITRNAAGATISTLTRPRLGGR